MQIFDNFYDYSRFLKTFIYYSIEGPKPKFSIFTPETKHLDRSKTIVDIVCFCLMPNHFHFLLRQNREGGITEFVSKLSNSYTKYFNFKRDRVGPLLQGDFKSVHVDTNEQLIHLSRYIHLNPLIGHVIEDLESYKWSFYREYIGLQVDEICKKDIILDQFQSKGAYKRFVLDQADFAKRLEMIKHQLLDFEE